MHRATISSPTCSWAKVREHQRHRVAVFQHIESGRPGIGGCRDRGRARIDRPFMLDFCLRPVLPPGLLFLLPVLPLRRPVRLELLAEFLPPLSTAAAGSVLAAGKDRAVAELDRKGPVLVGRRERALVEDEECAAAVRFLGPHPDAVIGEPAAQVEALALRSCRLLLCVLFGRQPGCEIPELFRRRDAQLIRGREYPAPPVRAVRVYRLPSARPCRRVSRCGPR